jgi:cobalt-precorrin-5B (C1)-methyltransferase
MTLHTGFTTGTAAAAAAKAAVIHLLTGKARTLVDVPLPTGDRMDISVLENRLYDQGAESAVMKDGGDNPDVTHKAVIRARVTSGFQTETVLVGGSGVGMVTRPGLPVPVGLPAINPAPRAQILQAVDEAKTLCAAPLQTGFRVEISVDEGEKLAAETFNPRLGIVGGISILGTRGTVKPFSHWAYQATIRQCLDVIHAAGLTPCLTTGGRSERFLRLAEPSIAETACVQVADFFSFAMREAGKRGFPHVLWAIFFGKLVKHAQGHRYTHARDADLSLTRLAAWCEECGFDAASCAKVAAANTARQVQEEMAEHPQMRNLYTLLTGRAQTFARKFSGTNMQVDYLLLDFSGRVLHDTRMSGC